MRVTVHLFARLKELAGRDVWTVDLADTAVAGDAWAAAVAAHPSLAPFERAVSCAINAQFARMTSPLREGDDIAFLPPVSGG